jgi:hypothetical protein
MVWAWPFLQLHHGSAGLGIQREALQLQLDNRGKRSKLQLCYMLQFVLLEKLLEDVMEGKKNNSILGRVSLLLWAQSIRSPVRGLEIFWREIFRSVSLLGL